MKSLTTYIAEAEQYLSQPQAGDEFDIEIARDEKVLSTYIAETQDDKIIIAADPMMFTLLENYGYIGEDDSEDTSKQIVINGKPVDLSTIELDDVYSWDYPDYADAYVSRAEFTDGTELTDDELEELTDKHGDIVNMKAHDMLESVEESEVDEGWKAGAATLAALAGLSGAAHYMDSDLAKNSVTIQSIDRAIATAEARGDTKGRDYYKKLRRDVKDEIEAKGRDPQDKQGNPVVVTYKDRRLNTKMEAKYHGRTVPLNKPMKGDVKKSKVYVKDPSTGNIKKVNFGDPNMKIKKSNPKRRKSFRARHNCDNPGPKTSARYWSCRAW